LWSGAFVLEKAMPHAIRVHETGGPEVLKWEEVDVGDPGPGQVRLRQEAAGLNYIDVYHRTGLYPQPLPFIPGVEGAGVVDAVGSGVADLTVGDRVAYGGPVGGYAEVRLIAADRVVKVPDGISSEEAAAMMLQGMTAEMLLKRVHAVKAGETVLIHAAAGGVGLILCQWGKALGANVIGTVGSEDKGKLAKANGCDHLIYYRKEDFAARVKEITKGELCAVVYDGIGKTTFPASLDCLRPLGMFASFGSASGQIEAFNINILQTKGSLFATRPTLNTYAAKRADLLDIAKHLFEVIGSGKVKIPINQTYKLKDARKAHEDLEGRNTTGSTILVP
jgi:NADPH:quinone reductase